MAYACRQIPASEQTVTAWSGGTTTELAIFPPGASYPARDFAWRISTAVVTAEESTFTALPGWHRLLMVLSGQMHLKHEGHHDVTLMPFKQDSFSGRWSTRCVGTGQDFNLMLAEGWQGNLQNFHLTEHSVLTIAPRHPDATEAFYCFAGCACISFPRNNGLALQRGDFLLLQPVGSGSRFIQIEVENCSAILIRASIYRE